MATGDASGTWGTTTNTNLELIGEALGYGTEAITTNADTHTTTVADGASDAGRAMYLKYTGTLDSACTITIAPNTMKRMQFIENGTSGSQNIIISQGSGANITIPPGDTKAVYLDGAGSGAAVVDAFASLNVVDLKVQDDLTVTDDLIVNGDIDLEGSIDVNGTTNLDVVDIDGAVDMATTLAVAGNVDFNGDLDVDGTANLDVVDIDGAVDMASSLTVGGAFTSLGIDDNADATALTINSSEQVLINVTSPYSGSSANLTVKDAIDVGTNEADQGTIAFTRSATTGIIGSLKSKWTGYGEGAEIRFHADNVSGGAQASSMTFHTTTGNSASEKMKIAGNGQVSVDKSAYIKQVAITSSSNAVAWDAAAAANAYHVTTENTTFSAPSSAVEGAIISVELAQGGTARTVAWNTVFEFAASTAPTVTATANKTDIFSFRYNGSVWQEIGRVQNMAQT